MCCIQSIYNLFASLNHFKEDNLKSERSRENSNMTASIRLYDCSPKHKASY